MIGATLAIGDFMLMLLTAVGSVVLGIAEWVFLGIVIVIFIVVTARRFLRRRH